MKKNTIILFCLLYLNTILWGQESKLNNAWAIGYMPVITMDFNLGLVVDTVKNATPTTAPFCILKSTANICDTNGALRLFTGGYIIYDKEGFAMENGILVNCPYGTVLANHLGGGGSFPQTSIILPKSGNQYYVFNVGMSDSVANNYINSIFTEFDVLSYCVVDMDSNQGKGKVILKDKVLSDKQHYYNTAMTAVKHANGKDWWLVKADCFSHRLQEFLVREDSILGPFYQNITDTGDFCTFLGTLRFSLSGKYLASGMYGMKINGLYNHNRADIYDFNRCDGSINYKQYYMTPMDTSSYWDWDHKFDICFSGNDSLLYMSHQYTIYQIDLSDTNINNGLFIHGPDTLLDYFPLYHLMGLAPDGRIYIGNWHGIRGNMSYIDKPNIKGLGCDFKPRGFQQNFNHNLKTPPNNPNYGLGKDTTKICWPLQNENEYEEENEWVVYPNPTSGKLYIRYHTAWRVAVLKQLYNSIGQLMLQTKEDELDVSHLPKGVYYLHCRNAVRKVVVE
jgi:hypothetical protein